MKETMRTILFFNKKKEKRIKDRLINPELNLIWLSRWIFYRFHYIKMRELVFSFWKGSRDKYKKK